MQTSYRSWVDWIEERISTPRRTTTPMAMIHTGFGFDFFAMRFLVYRFQITYCQALYPIKSSDADWAAVLDFDGRAARDPRSIHFF